MMHVLKIFYTIELILDEPLVYKHLSASNMNAQSEHEGLASLSLSAQREPLLPDEPLEDMFVNVFKRQ